MEPECVVVVVRVEEVPLSNDHMDDIRNAALENRKHQEKRAQWISRMHVLFDDLHSIQHSINFYLLLFSEKSLHVDVVKVLFRRKVLSKSFNKTFFFLRFGFFQLAVRVI